MDHDFVSPFARYFEEESFVVRASEKRAEQATLFLSYYPTLGQLSLAVYDGAAHEYTHTFAGEAPAVSSFLQTVEAAYGCKVPSSFYEKPRRFLELVGESFGVTVELEENIRPCSTCGDYTGNSVDAFYFPAIAEGYPASLAMHNNYGCYGGSGIYGEAEEATRATAVRLLQEALVAPHEPTAAAEVRAFLERLSTVS